MYSSNHDDHSQGKLVYDTEVVMYLAQKTRREAKKGRALRRSSSGRESDVSGHREKQLIAPNASSALLFNIAHSDCTFHIQDADNSIVLETIPVHKMLLSAGSHMFERMFLSDMSECHTGIVTITDFPPEIVKEMLRFIYTGNCTGRILLENADSMVMIAQKYVVKHMVDYLEQFFVLNVENQASLSILWSLSQTWSMKSLESAVLSCIVSSSRRHLNDSGFRHSLDRKSLQKILSAVTRLSESFVSDEEEEESVDVEQCSTRVQVQKTFKFSDLLASRLRYSSEPPNLAPLAPPQDGDAPVVVTALLHDY